MTAARIIHLRNTVGGTTEPETSITTPAQYRDYARERLEEALSDLDSDEAIGTVELALMALAMYNESYAAITLEPSDVEELVNPAPRECTCPPGLAERGGFRAGCGVHDPGAGGTQERGDETERRP